MRREEWDAETTELLAIVERRRALEALEGGGVEEEEVGERREEDAELWALLDLAEGQREERARERELGGEEVVEVEREVERPLAVPVRTPLPDRAPVERRRSAVVGEMARAVERRTGRGLDGQRFDGMGWR